MNVTLETHEAFQVMGVDTMIDPTQADYAAIWSQQYDPHDGDVLAAGGGPDCLGVYYCQGDTQSLFVAGRIIPADAVSPEGLSVHQVPGGLWAQFSCSFDDIGAIWQAIYSQWLPAQTHLRADNARPSYEVFPPDTMSGGRIRICIPVEEC